MGSHGELHQHLQSSQHISTQDPTIDFGYGTHANPFSSDHYGHSNLNLSMFGAIPPASTGRSAGNGGSVQQSGMKRTYSDLNTAFSNYQQQNLHFQNLPGNFNISTTHTTTPIQKRVQALESHRPEMSPRGSSKYTGVCWNKKQKKWRTRLSNHGKVEFLGDFPDEESAAVAYDRRAKEVFGEGAKKLNFPATYPYHPMDVNTMRPTYMNFPREHGSKNRVTPVGLKQNLLQQVEEEAKKNGNDMKFPKSLSTAVEETGPNGEVEVATQQHKKFLIAANRYYMGSSGYKGVCWNKKKKKWRARISNQGKREFLGDWDCEVRAAMIYDARARQLFQNLPNLRERLNFPDGVNVKVKEQGNEKNGSQQVDGQNTTNETSVKAPDEVSIQEQGNGNDGTERYDNTASKGEESGFNTGPNW